MPPVYLVKRRRKRRSLSKREIDLRHFIDRMKKRYKIRLTPDEVLHIGNLIKQGKSIQAGHTSTYRSRHIVEYKGRRFLVAYDTRRHNPVTVLPQAKLEQIEREIAEKKGAQE